MVYIQKWANVSRPIFFFLNWVPSRITGFILTVCIKFCKNIEIGGANHLNKKVTHGLRRLRKKCTWIAHGVRMDSEWIAPIWHMDCTWMAHELLMAIVQIGPSPLLFRTLWFTDQRSTNWVIYITNSSWAILILYESSLLTQYT